MRAMWTKQLLTSVFIICVLACSGAAEDFVPFVIPAKPNNESPIAIVSYEPIRTDSNRLVVRSGHFYHGDQRVRLWGVNLSFGANLPKHEDAPHVAARLAAAGVNAVRCHHLDSARWPRGLWNTKDGKGIAPEALDRLDYFIDQLARHGICVNINLHVGRAHSQYLGLPKANRQYDKISNIFTPALIDAQKRYARELLTRVNPYRKVRYADDPAVAIIEITNENSFFMWGSEQTLRTLPPYYADILQNKFNAWLKKRYGSDDKLRNAWAGSAQPLGKNLIKNSNFRQIANGEPSIAHWHDEEHAGCLASIIPFPYRSKFALSIKPAKIDDTEWHLQLNQPGIPLNARQYYTVTFEAASDRPRSISCSVGQSHSPWQNLGLSRRVELSHEWQTFRYGFVAKANDDNARLNFAFGGSKVPVYLANVEFRTGGRVGLDKNESIEAGSVPLFADNETPTRTLDRMCFLAETEKDYFDQMRNFIKNELNCKALITGTIVFGPLGLYAQSDMDFIDTHAYWQHPRFPGRPWDSGNWVVEQKPMTDYPAEATLFQLAAKRLAGKPFTVSEYNHPAPLDSQAECVPMIASFAAAHDWDGVWLYTYSHSSDNWDREVLNSYFDIDTNPAKWGFMRAGTAIFRHAGIEPLNDCLVVSLTDTADIVPSLAKLHLKNNQDIFAVFSERAGISRDDILKTRLVASLGGEIKPQEFFRPSGRLNWSVENGKGIYIAHGQCASVYTGRAERFEEATGGQIAIAQPALVTITVTALDKMPLNHSRKILVTACGRCENTGMKFSKDRRTVGRNWGGPPVRIEVVEGTLILPAGQWMCHALGPDGLPKRQVSISYTNGRGVLQFSSQYKTMWYLLIWHTKQQ